jgi:hypothetical protein
MGVCATVLEDGGDEDLAIAALLHDAVEDQGGRPTLETIRRLFGDRVAGVIAECSDTDQVPKPPWYERKRAYLDHLRTASADVRLVSAADKLNNVRNILADYRQVGEDLWDRFNATGDDEVWFYRSVISALREAGPNPIADEMQKMLDQLEGLKMKNGDARDKVSVYDRPPQAARVVEQPSAATAWAEFAVELSRALADLNEDEYLMISTKRNPYYIQFAGQGSFGVRAETISNQYLPRDKKLPNEVATVLVELGWKTPTKLPENPDPEGHSPDGSPNYFLDIAPPVPYDALAKLSVQTLMILGAKHPGALQYKAFNEAKENIRFPNLRIMRER